ncbi:MAG: hypothetical protein FVQ81_11685 [Candidatus Glassbacteria bacterium]|nr:hypothetical protein [Candidatus Glassbacteria bacterium]
MKDREELMRLLTAFADGELDESERERVERLLADDPELRGELESIRNLNRLTVKIRLTEPEQEVWNMYWANVYNRLERGVGWILLSVGAIILIAYGAWHFVRDFLLDPEVPLLMRTGVSAALLGAIVLLVSVLRERLFARKKERYEEIVR